MVYYFPSDLKKLSCWTAKACQQRTNIFHNLRNQLSRYYTTEWEVYLNRLPPYYQVRKIKDVKIK